MSLCCIQSCRKSFWTFSALASPPALLFAFLVCVLSTTLAVAENTQLSDERLAELRDNIHKNIGKLSEHFGQEYLSEEEKQAALNIVEETDQILAQKDLSDEFRVWTLGRRALALIHLAYSETPKYFPILSGEIELFEEQPGCEKIARIAEEHILRIGCLLALRPIPRDNGKPFTVKPDVLAEWMLDYAERYPGNKNDMLLAEFVTKIYAAPSPMLRDKLLAAIAPGFAKYFLASDNPKVNSVGKKLASSLRRVTLPGKPMSLNGFDLNGKPFNAATLQNKVVLVVFWGTWCVPCREKTPDLIELYEKYRSQGFEIVGVNTGTKGGDDKPNKVQQYVSNATFGPDKKKMTWPIILDSLAEANGMVKISDYYDIDILPESILIGRDGNVLKLNPLPSAYEKEIRSALYPKQEIDESDEELKAAIQRENDELQKELEQYQKAKDGRKQKENRD